MKRESLWSLALSTSLCLALAAPAIAQAQDAVHGDVGAQIVGVPDYLGSNQTRTHIAPVLNIDFSSPLFYAGNRYGGLPLQLGVTPLHSTHWAFGADIEYQTIMPRSDTTNAYPIGIPEISRTALGGVFAQYRYDGFSAGVRTESDLLGNKQGTTVTVNARQAFPLNDQLTFALGPQFVWGNREHMETFFGIDTQASMQSQLPAYTPGSGAEEISLLLDLRYLLTPSWVLGSGVSIGRLSGPAANSPLVADRTQVRWSLLAAYKF